MKQLSIRIRVLIVVLLGAMAACQVEPPGSAPNGKSSGGSTNTNTSPSGTSSSQPSATSGASWAVTLAVLDSFLGDSTLASEVQSQLEITDDELKKLREISRGATERLEDAEAEDRGDYASVSELRRKAEVEIRQVLGEERTHRLFELIARRWSGGDASELAILPSAVPADTRIVINIPAFRMDLFESGQLIKSYLIGIGYPEFPLPSGLRRAEQIIFNPPWTPPDSEWVEKDKRIKPGKTIKPGDRLNPLGVMKVPIGLPSLIHGGKAPSKIGSFASHGCVGLTNAQAKDFVLHLARLGGAELT
ncbi:MAG TPA: L,D-transpeptidase, partial [Blastocatellia bacterium]|nr:L,D-transpeptidase [Blastocatellia bacterium]